MTNTNVPVREGEGGNQGMMRYAAYIGAAAFALLFVLFAIYQPSFVSLSRPGANSTGPALPTKADKEAAATAAEVALGRTILESKKMELRQADAALQEFNAEVDRWESEVTPLLTNETGRYVAADAELVKGFDTTYSRGRASRAEAADMLAKVAPVRSFIETSLADPRAMLAPPKEIPALVSIVLEQLKNATAAYRNDRETILAVAHAAQAAGEKSTQTLGDAITALRQRYATERMELLGQKREQAEIETRKQLADLEYHKRREIGEAEAAKKEAEMEAERLRIQTEAELATEKAKEDRLVARASDPAVQAKYTPFLGKGQTVLATRGAKQYYWAPTSGPRSPTSLSDLKHKHVLDGVERFVAAATAQGNDRGAWPLPTNDPDWQRYRERLLEFNELAPTWVKLGVLKP